uniref:ADP-ribosylation factor-like protein 15 n=1 Tax=Taeniopygia guttata TaxID=59729 RepID=A0A674H1W6_TAEGU
MSRRLFFAVRSGLLLTCRTGSDCSLGGSPLLIPLVQYISRRSLILTAHLEKSKLSCPRLYVELMPHYQLLLCWSVGFGAEFLLPTNLQCFRALCCKGPPPPRPEYDLVCIGLSGSGKTSLLSQLCSESPENIVSTTGFSIKAVPFQNAILNVKELGGADNIRKYWSRYYQGSQGVIFVLDSASSEDDLETARNELHSALQHPQLCTLPFLILANHQDKPAARSVQERCLKSWHLWTHLQNQQTYKKQNPKTSVEKGLSNCNESFPLPPS